MSEPVVELKGVSKIYTLGLNKIHALDNVDLNIQKGEFISVMGPSGSGKSTLLNLVGCLDLPTSGAVLIDGIATSGLNDDRLTTIRRDKIGFIFQQFNLIPTLTAIENVEMPMIFRRAPAQLLRKKALRLFEMVGLEAIYADHRQNELSGGQQQRVAVARALANDPALILADEPTGNLDTKTGIAIMNLLSELNDRGATIVMVTHDPRLSTYADRIVEMIDGQIDGRIG
ncbi:MAG: ABC transporter ATP-binding protein [Euryarchaeota archaeon]|nr:MAG: putative ABC transporter ATP-binding protein [ANME-2 cluster archaeon]MEA1865233.1 ABC transporter ATP-binding protein [Euryarchaeota archaeon]